MSHTEWVHHFIEYIKNDAFMFNEKIIAINDSDKDENLTTCDDVLSLANIEINFIVSFRLELCKQFVWGPHQTIIMHTHKNMKVLVKRKIKLISMIRFFEKEIWLSRFNS